MSPLDTLGQGGANLVSSITRKILEDIFVYQSIELLVLGSISCKHPTAGFLGFFSPSLPSVWTSRWVSGLPASFYQLKTLQEYFWRLWF